MEKNQILEMLSYQKDQIKKETLLIRNLKKEMRNKDIEGERWLYQRKIQYQLNDLNSLNSKRHYWYFMLKNIKKEKYKNIILNKISVIKDFGGNEKDIIEYLYTNLSLIK